MKLLIIVDAESYRSAIPATARSFVFEAALLVAVSEGDLWRIDKDRSGRSPDHVTPEELAKIITPGD